MVKLKEAIGVEVNSDIILAEVAGVCSKIPPLWDLRNYVAVNPFLGFASEPFDAAAQVVGDGLDARVLPGLEFYRSRWNEGVFGMTELVHAARRSGQDPEILEAILSGRTAMPLRTTRPVLPFAERYDLQHGTEWNDLIIRSVARWCAVHASKGGTHWYLPTSGLDLYASWREAAQVDRSLEIAGLRGWRDWVKRLPDQPSEAIRVMLARLRVSPAMRASYLYRLLAGLYGWASYFRRFAWQEGTHDTGAVADLLAIRICTDAAVVELVRPSARPLDEIAPKEVEDESTLLVFQEALEDGFARRLLGKLADPSRLADSDRPAVQAVFCIDVRSEPLRRHLEEQSVEIETRGFAGFFGVALDWHVGNQHSPRCPVLLKPSVCLHQKTPAPSGTRQCIIKHVQTAPAASFSFVEMLGLVYGLGLASDALTATPTDRPTDDFAAFQWGQVGLGGGISQQARLDLASGILKNMGLRKIIARLVLLCGHEGHSANNPHAASLNCGACGGHGGAINARVAVAILNDPAIRAGLAGRGWNLPADTYFLAGVHNTSTDEVQLLDGELVPAEHAADLKQLRVWLAQAGTQVRRERANALGLGTQPVGFLDRLMGRRARDWSEVLPEWGLARNAAFIAARRGRTRGVDLEGRAFLHEYDATTDPDNSILSLILSAPMVVASWINLQYFASTVDNRTFGCGTKALHNRVGTLGVVLGNGGDLRTGLAIQSVHASDGRWFHEPLRLQVVVETTQERIEQVLVTQNAVRELVDNGWVRLFALDSYTRRMSLRIPGGGWEHVDAIAP